MGIADNAQLIVAEYIDDKNLFPPPQEPKELFDQVVEEIQESEEGTSMAES